MGRQVFPGDCKNSSPPFEAKDDQPRRRGSRTDSVGGMLTRIQELADHLTQHVRGRLERQQISASRWLF